ncbi:DUF2752 domain-containing protein [Nocardia sp. NBC_01388]|uniref:DUF2752 domain-containing protein n=1 Tax=Nocardia sp. NBC_01388 TaxID=2903596 RepID=UPI0032496C0F
MMRTGFGEKDSIAWLTWTAMTLLVAAAALAVVGVPSVDLHGPLHRMGIMDPACGGTRSVYLFLHGDVARSLRYNPVGAVVIIGAVVLALRAVAGRLTGRWVSVSLPRHSAVAVAAVALLVLEINQQAHADLLTSPWTG